MEVGKNRVGEKKGDHGELRTAKGVGKEGVQEE